MNGLTDCGLANFRIIERFFTDSITTTHKSEDPLIGNSPIRQFVNPPILQSIHQSSLRIRYNIHTNDNNNAIPVS